MFSHCPRDHFGVPTKVTNQHELGHTRPLSTHNWSGSKQYLTRKVHNKTETFGDHAFYQHVFPQYYYCVLFCSVLAWLMFRVDACEFI